MMVVPDVKYRIEAHTAKGPISFGPFDSRIEAEQLLPERKREARGMRVRRGSWRIVPIVPDHLRKTFDIIAAGEPLPPYNSFHASAEELASVGFVVAGGRWGEWSLPTPVAAEVDERGLDRFQKSKAV
jgi:hypothetical protein